MNLKHHYRNIFTWVKYAFMTGCAPDGNNGIKYKMTREEVKIQFVITMKPFQRFKPWYPKFNIDSEYFWLVDKVHGLFGKCCLAEFVG